MSESKTPEANQAMQPDSQFVIAALREELQAAQDNRLYLLSVIKQMQHEFAEAKTLWDLERDSLIKRHEDVEDTNGTD